MISTHFIILGATRDLTSRYLIPALVQLHAKEQILSESIIGVSREDWDTERFRRHLADRLQQQAADFPQSSVKAVLQKLQYRQADVTQKEQLRKVIGERQQPVAV